MQIWHQGHFFLGGGRARENFKGQGTYLAMKVSKKNPNAPKFAIFMLLNSNTVLNKLVILILS